MKHYKIKPIFKVTVPIVALAILVFSAIKALYLDGVPLFSFMKSQPITIWSQDDVINKPSEQSTSITKVDILSDTCNKVTLKISYNNALNKTDGYFRITASHRDSNNNYDGYVSDHAEEIPLGKGVITFNNYITNERDSASSQEIWVSIEEIVNNRFKDITYRTKIKYEKQWDHNCSYID